MKDLKDWARSREPAQSLRFTAFNAANALEPGDEVNSQIAMGSDDDAEVGDWAQLLPATTISFKFESRESAQSLILHFPCLGGTLSEQIGLSHLARSLSV